MDYRAYARGDLEEARANAAAKVRKHMAESLKYGKWAEAAPDGLEKETMEGLCRLYKSMATDAYELYVELQGIRQRGECGEYARKLSE